MKERFGQVGDLWLEAETEEGGVGQEEAGDQGDS
jgi:hypothetical protein